ncbi:MAG: TldD/PmbA family protein [Eubacteriales bacterium]
MDEQALLNLAESASKGAKQAGAGEAEAYLSYNREFSAEVRNGQAETIKVALDRGLGLRVVQNGRVGFAYTSDLEKESMKNIADQAIANARETAADPYRIFPSPSSLYPELDLYDTVLIKTSVEAKIDLAKAMEEAARAFDPRVKIIESSNYQDIEACVTLVNSKGIKNSYRATYCGIYLSLVAEEGEDQQTGFAMDYRLRFEDLDAVKIGREAAFRAVRMLGAKPVSTRKTAVLFDPHVAAGFLDLLGPALTAEAVQKGRSLFMGRVNQPVAAQAVNIIDDGILPGGIASAPFDGEGVQMSRKTLIERGILKGYLHNTYTAAKENVASTGNCMRSSYKSAPDVGTTNFFIQPGGYTADELINSTGSGIYITEVIGMHTANPISGDFSVGATGILIENGQLTQPVRGIAIAGNIQEVLQQIDGIGSDLVFFGGHGSPTIRIARMVVSGH